MKLGELLTRYEARAREADALGSTAPVSRMYRAVIEELRQVDGIGAAGRWMDTAEAADALAVSTKTVRRWITDGRFPSARKTSEDGEWRIPALEVYAGAADGRREGTTTPKLWRAEDG